MSLNNVVIIGHSNGADVMLELASLNNPAILGLVAVDYFKNVDVPLPDKVISQTLAGLKTDFAGTNEQYARQVLLTDKTNPEIVARVVKDFRNMSPKVGIPFSEGAFTYTNRETALLKALTLKLYIINVDYFPTNEDNLRGVLGNNFKLHTISGTSHFPMIEVAETFNKVLEDIILKITA